MILRVITAAVLVPSLIGCMNPIATPSKRQVPLRYVGAFSFGEPVLSGGSTVVPLVVDFATGEWMMNSALVLYGTVARVDERTASGATRAETYGGRLRDDLRRS